MDYRIFNVRTYVIIRMRACTPYTFPCWIFQVTFELESIGRTSVTLTSCLVETSTGKTTAAAEQALVTSRSVLVSVDQRTGQSAPLPDRLLRKLASFRGRGSPARQLKSLGEVSHTLIFSPRGTERLFEC